MLKSQFSRKLIFLIFDMELDASIGKHEDVKIKSFFLVFCGFHGA